MFWSAFVYSSNGDFIDSAVCDTVGIGQEIHYKAEISISSCELGNRHKRFKIKPADLSDSMIVDVEINCACECHDEVSLSYCISVPLSTILVPADHY